MSETNFPSGPWTGFYNYRAGGRKHRMDLSLTFANGRITGDGIDDLAPFIISGGYNSIGKECNWTKTYIGAHAVFYCGFREGKGIWGLWNLVIASGGFHIWPLGDEKKEEQTATAAEPISAEAIASGKLRLSYVSVRPLLG